MTLIRKRYTLPYQRVAGSVKRLYLCLGICCLHTYSLLETVSVVEASKKSKIPRLWGLKLGIPVGASNEFCRRPAL